MGLSLELGWGMQVRGVTPAELQNSSADHCPKQLDALTAHCSRRGWREGETLLINPLGYDSCSSRQYLVIQMLACMCICFFFFLFSQDNLAMSLGVTDAACGD